MSNNFRQAMAWVHTWFGLVLGFVLMAAFFFGALSVFDREIDRWAIPVTRIEPQPMPSFEKVLRPAFERMQPTPEAVDAMRPRVDGPMPERFDTVVSWSAYTTHRDPVLALYAGYQGTQCEGPGGGDLGLRHHRPAQRHAPAGRPAQGGQRVLLPDALQPDPGLEERRLLDRRPYARWRCWPRWSPGW